jgi:hypothetical protein
VDIDKIPENVGLALMHFCITSADGRPFGITPILYDKHISFSLFFGVFLYTSLKAVSQGSEFSQLSGSENGHTKYFSYSQFVVYVYLSEPNVINTLN